MTAEPSPFASQRTYREPARVESSGTSAPRRDPKTGALVTDHAPGTPPALDGSVAPASLREPTAEEPAKVTASFQPTGVVHPSGIYAARAAKEAA